MAVSEANVLEALRSVIDPDLRRDIVTLGFVKNVQIEGDHVSFIVELTTPACPVKDQLKQECEERVSALEGVSSVSVEMTAQVRQRQTAPQDLIPGVKHCIAIASGKGGVGKSTVTVNLAVALAQTGARVGLMDADVYGPSIPLMLGAESERPYTQGNKIIPIERYGLRTMSLGSLLEEGQAVLWRGPMVAGTVKQLLEDVDWGELDYLLVDLPPGTGDAPMSLAQLAPLTGVVIVTTPHHVAANIAGKSVHLFRRLNAPIIGVVENMAGFVCPNCGEVSRIFSGMTGEELSQQLKVPYLGSVPLDPSVSDAGDKGVPAIISAPHRPQAESFKEIAGKLAQQASIFSMTRRDLTQLSDGSERPKFSAVD
ncbi:MAG: chromosome partitioning protein [Armatimonadetes bacterium 55-13]|nr:Mrp/NBP35 family ATP-binding protein [Armatimonadota bacterium]OJU65366.1 MAG: chromosome partitioning protein [Armatimonadetes bacterium 55-13]